MTLSYPFPFCLYPLTRSAPEPHTDLSNLLFCKTPPPLITWLVTRSILKIALKCPPSYSQSWNLTVSIWSLLSSLLFNYLWPRTVFTRHFHRDNPINMTGSIKVLYWLTYCWETKRKQKSEKQSITVIEEKGHKLDNMIKLSQHIMLKNVLITIDPDTREWETNSDLGVWSVLIPSLCCVPKLCHQFDASWENKIGPGAAAAD